MKKSECGEINVRIGEYVKKVAKKIKLRRKTLESASMKHEPAEKGVKHEN